MHLFWVCSLELNNILPWNGITTPSRLYTVQSILWTSVAYLFIYFFANCFYWFSFRDDIIQWWYQCMAFCCFEAISLFLFPSVLCKGLWVCERCNMSIGRLLFVIKLPLMVGGWCSVEKQYNLYCITEYTSANRFGQVQSYWGFSFWVHDLLWTKSSACLLKM